MNENLSIEYGWCIAALVIAGIVVTLAAAVIRAHKGDSHEPIPDPSRAACELGPDAASDHVT